MQTIGRLVLGFLALAALANIHHIDDVVRSVFNPTEYKDPLLENLEKLNQPQQP